jgi:hypothetical protein
MAPGAQVLQNATWYFQDLSAGLFVGLLANLLQ